MGGAADGRLVYTEQPVLVRSVQQFVQLVQRSAGRVPRQEGRLLWQVTNQLQGDALWEVPRPGGQRDREADMRSGEGFHKKQFLLS